jgi:uncharacterized protein
MYDVVIVGGGPAGLAAGAACAKLGVRSLLLEQGPELAARTYLSLGIGAGGAGLYSDGKFSFYPSATRLWRIEPQLWLREAYDWLAGLLATHGIEAPQFPIDREDSEERPSDSTVNRKSYLSRYGNLQARSAIIRELEAQLGDREFGIRARWIDRLEGIGYRLELSDGLTVDARSLVLAGGRFGPLLVDGSDVAWSRADFQRLEVGIRLEQKADTFFLREEAQLDPKILLRDEDAAHEWRTFCCCRNGRIDSIRLANMVSASGHSDGPPTGYSNVGFNLRISEEAAGSRLWGELQERLMARRELLTTPVELALKCPASEANPLIPLFGHEVTALLRQGLLQLGASMPAALSPGTMVYAPTVEGIAYYPKVDANLRVGADNIWVAGDMSGLFRGLTAALVSGFFAGICASNSDILESEARIDG